MGGGSREEVVVNKGLVNGSGGEFGEWEEGAIIKMAIAPEIYG